MHLGVDIDGTIADTRTIMMEVLNKELNRNFTIYDLNEYELDKFYGPLTDSVFLANEAEIYEFVSPILNAAVVLQEFLAKGNSIDYITSRPPKFFNQTLAWLEKHGFPAYPYARLFMAEEKSHIAKRLGIDCFVEDAPSQIISLAKEMPVAIFDQPYNQKINLPKTVRATNWDYIHTILF